MEVRIDKEKKDKWVLLTSSNGYQWSGGSSMTIEEIKQVKAEIDRFLEEVDKNE